MPMVRFGESPGTLRPSQITATFGPGSLVQMEHDSVIIMGTDTWSRNEKHYKILNHPYLEAVLNKDYFKMPISSRMSKVISCRSFPTWGVCSNVSCSRLQQHKAAPPDGRRQFKCGDCGNALYAARFVVMCDKGHLDDFPWVEWVHHGSKDGPCKKSPRLTFRARGKSPGLSDYYVRCECGLSRSCGYATSRDALKNITPGCSGYMPWLERNEECTNERGEPSPVYGFHVLSTSLYYPSSITALHIPEWLHPIQKMITDNKPKISGMFLMDSSYRKVAEMIPSIDPGMKNYTTDEIAEHLEKRFALKRHFGRSATELQIRDKEYEDLMLGESSKFDDNEDLEITEGRLDKSLEGYVERMKLIKRITEIRVIRGFTRGEAPDPYSSEETQKIHYCHISKHKMDWYPAIENRGEGFLFALDEGKLREWESRPEIVARCKAIISAFGEWAKQKKWTSHETIVPRYILLHTLSHTLIRELANLSGYSEASIRERIYRGAGKNGILLYTATPSSDGSLGGLVRQGEAKNQLTQM